jgi:hypothetical protein
MRQLRLTTFTTMNHHEEINALLRFPSLEFLDILVASLPNDDNDNEGDEEEANELLKERYQLRLASVLSSLTSLTRLEVMSDWQLESGNEDGTSSYIWDLPHVTYLCVNYHRFIPSKLTLPILHTPSLTQFHMRVTGQFKSSAMKSLIPSLTPLFASSSLTTIEIPLLHDDMISLLNMKTLRHLVSRQWIGEKGMNQILSTQWNDLTFFEMGSEVNGQGENKGYDHASLVRTLLPPFPTLRMLRLFGHPPHQYRFAASASVPTSTSSSTSSEASPTIIPRVVNDLLEIVTSQAHLDLDVLRHYSFTSLTSLSLKSEMKHIETLGFIQRCCSLTELYVWRFFQINESLQSQVDEISLSTSLLPSLSLSLPSLPSLTLTEVVSTTTTSKSAMRLLPFLSSLAFLKTHHSLLIPFLRLLNKDAIVNNSNNTNNGISNDTNIMVTETKSLTTSSSSSSMKGSTVARSNLYDSIFIRSFAFAFPGANPLLLCAYMLGFEQIGDIFI